MSVKIAELLNGLLHISGDRLAREDTAELVAELRDRPIEAPAQQRTDLIGISYLLGNVALYRLTTVSPIDIPYIDVDRYGALP